MSSPISLRSAHTLDEPKIEALIEIMYLAAYADGDFAPEEKQHFVRSVQSLTDRKVTPEMLQRRPHMREVLERLEPVGIDEYLEDGSRLELAGGLRVIFGGDLNRPSEDYLLRHYGEVDETAPLKPIELVAWRPAHEEKVLNAAGWRTAFARRSSM